MWVGVSRCGWACQGSTWVITKTVGKVYFYGVFPGQNVAMLGFPSAACTVPAGVFSIFLSDKWDQSSPNLTWITDICAEQSSLYHHVDQKYSRGNCKYPLVRSTLPGLSGVD